MKAYISEFIGTFILVLFGCGSMVAANFLVGAMGLMLPLGLTTLTTALAFGITMTLMYYTFRKVSGSHFNPAISLAVLMDGGFKHAYDFVGYILAQFLGGTAGACVVWLVTGQNSTLGQTGYDSLSPLYLGMISVIVIELIISFVFVLIYMTVRDNDKLKNHAGFIIGMALSAVYIFGIPFTGGSANPARSFGPAVFALGDSIKQLPIFIVTPLVGAVLAFFVYRLIISDKPFGKTKELSLETEEEEITESLEYDEIETDITTEENDFATEETIIKDEAVVETEAYSNMENLETEEEK